MTPLLYPTTNLKETEQLIITHAKGVYVYDNHGRKYLEGLSGLWCTSLGYGNEELIDAAANQMRTLSYQHLFGGKTHPTAIALAERLAAMLPMKKARVFFGTSGSDANDTHWKLLRYYFNAIGKPEKRKIISRSGSYHGVTVVAASFTGLPANHTHFDLPFDALGIVRAEGANFYRQGLPGETEAQFATRLAKNLEELILREDPRTIAAFIAEPITGAGGVVVPPLTYWEKIQAVLNKYEILLIDDEVITGFGRTGNDFGATTVGMKSPQMMTMAKAVTSGYLPLSASAITEDIYHELVAPSDKVGIFGHGFTYSGHPASCAVALKTLEIYERDKIFEHAARVGTYLQKRLREFESHPLVGNVRGAGLIAVLELVANKTTRQPFEGNRVGASTQLFAQSEGLIVRALTGSCIAICPPLIITEQEVDELVNALAAALEKVTDVVKREVLLVA